MSEQNKPTITIHAALHGFPIDIAFAGSIEQLQDAVARLQKLGATPPPRASFGGGKPPSKLTQPAYDGAGNPCCPIHKRSNGSPTPARWWPGKDGRPGFWGCPAVSDGTPGETVNARGYCDLRFDAPAPDKTR